MKLSIFGVLMILAVGSAQKIRYDNYKVFSVVIEDDTQLQVMQDLQNAQGVIFWEAPEYVKTKVHVAIPPQQIEHFEDVVGNANVLSKLEIENLQDLIDEESPKINERSAKNVEDFNWTAYHDVDEIYAWLDHIAAQYPDKVTITDIGNTYEGRKMKVVKISFQEVFSIFFDNFECLIFKKLDYRAIAVFSLRLIFMRESGLPLPLQRSWLMSF